MPLSLLTVETNIRSMMVLYLLIKMVFPPVKVDILWFFGVIVQADIELNGAALLKQAKYLNARILKIVLLHLMAGLFTQNLYLI